MCKEQCCCGVNRSDACIRKHHCYKKCPPVKNKNSAEAAHLKAAAAEGKTGHKQLKGGSKPPKGGKSAGAKKGNKRAKGESAAKVRLI